MKTITYNKLVRDRIPEIVENAGKTACVEVLSDAEYQTAVDQKLGEELQEYLAEGDVTELADLLEVLYAAAQARGCSREELEKIRAEKAEKRGAFAKKLFLRYVEEQD